jgi:hypothetical protein
MVWCRIEIRPPPKYASLCLQRFFQRNSLWAVLCGVQPAVFQRRAINEALALAKLSARSTLYIPTSAQHLRADMFPGLKGFDVSQSVMGLGRCAAGLIWALWCGVVCGQLDQWFHTSAVFATAIHSLSLPFRYVCPALPCPALPCAASAGARGDGGG